MEFHKKLQELRKQKGITQEQLAEVLFVSRTAISKWESGRGYPNIESLKAIASYFSVTVDGLLSSDEVLNLAEAQTKRTEKDLRESVFGLLDLCASMLLFLPLFAERSQGAVLNASLLSLGNVPLYLRIAYFVLVIGTAVFGILTVALRAFEVRSVREGKEVISLVLGAVSVFVFTVSLQPYAAVFSFTLLAIKAFLMIKRR